MFFETRNWERLSYTTTSAVSQEQTGRSIPVANRLYHEVGEDAMETWEVKDEFEKTDAYLLRVSDLNHDEHRC